MLGTRIAQYGYKRIALANGGNWTEDEGIELSEVEKAATWWTIDCKGTVIPKIEDKRSRIQYSKIQEYQYQFVSRIKTRTAYNYQTNKLVRVSVNPLGKLTISNISKSSLGEENIQIYTSILLEP